jgi:uncharacterized repeat protein (TIGR03803 family)
MNAGISHWIVRRTPLLMAIALLALAGGYRAGAQQDSLPGHPSPAATEKVIYSFAGQPDGGNPYGALVLDPSGNLYGATPSGGNFATGTIFKLSPKSGGGWNEAILYNFGSYFRENIGSFGGLVRDSAGNLLGTTTLGGNGPCEQGCGTVFELQARSGKRWRMQRVYTFHAGGKDGALPYAGLFMDSAGHFFGTTLAGGTDSSCPGEYGEVGCGTVFELTSDTVGGQHRNIYSFRNNGKDGSLPYAGVIGDSAGNLYGTTYLGGNGYGTVYELLPKSGTAWEQRVLYSFKKNGKDGVNPQAALILDSKGNLYGTTTGGGNSKSTCASNGCGTVFELSGNKGGGWSEKVLYNFQSTHKDGWGPSASLVFDAAGNLYTTTSAGGSASLGTVVELSKSGGIWSEKVLHSFTGPPDGATPQANLIIDDGKLYSTTVAGGKGKACTGGCGTVFKLTP